MSLDQPSSAAYQYQDDIAPTPRCIRHISSFQVRNLTPFPVRDAFTSALSQPAQLSHLTTTGQVTDDLAAIPSKKRVRKVSTNTRISTSNDVAYDDGSVSDSAGVSRRRSVRKTSFSASGSYGPGSSQASQPSRSPHSFRTARPRTNSTTSSIKSHSLGTRPLPNFVIPGLPSNQSQSALLDNSQLALESVFYSRLVETFVTITITPTLPSPPPSKPSQPTPHITNRPNNFKTTKSSSVIKNATLVRPNGLLRHTTSSCKTPGTPPLFHSKIAQERDPFSSQKQSPLSLVLRRGAASKQSSNVEYEYVSPVHRASTNPIFIIDALPNTGFVKWADTSGHRLKLSLWGKSYGQRSNEDTTREGDQSEKRKKCFRDERGVEWRVLEEWDIDLIELTPLPDDLALHPSQLPSNTLLITLSPPDKTFYLLPSGAILSRSSTPSIGYTSDPESQMRNSKDPGGHFVSPSTIMVEEPTDKVIAFRRRQRKGRGEADPRISKTAEWKDIHSLVSLQTCIIDTEASLSDIVRNIDKTLGEDTLMVQRREMSERRDQIARLRADHLTSVEKSRQTRSDITSRTQKLQERRERLATAKEHDDGLRSYEVEMEQSITIERERLCSLRAELGPCRTSLVTTLSTIFPIELYSPPDLLYTILDVPLPIPLSSTDPAPPLALSSHKSVDEDSVATSLGFAAQLLQFLAAYLGKSLVYPVTCIGSRSLIKDGISAMVGPRMFPLYSKNVDTYRFEYGVFLLNKDIEMLMVERDLRALDMRHTLPNLKNLILTLSHGEEGQLQTLRSSDLSTLALSDTEIPSPERSPVDTNASTPKAFASSDLPSGATPPASRSTTPVMMQSDEKKTRPFIDLVPFTGFLRARYPSSRSSSNHVPEDSDVLQMESENGDADEQVSDDGEDDDHKTIQGVMREMSEQDIVQASE